MYAFSEHVKVPACMQLWCSAVQLLFFPIIVIWLGCNIYDNCKCEPRLSESISHSAGSSMKTRVWWWELHQRHGNRGWRWSVTGSWAKAIWRQAPGTLKISLQKTSPASSDSASENPLRLHDQISVSSVEHTTLYWLSIHRKLTNLLQYSIMEPLDCDDLLDSCWRQSGLQCC